MAQNSEERMQQLMAALSQDPGLVESIPSREGAMVRDAMKGLSVYEIAQKYSVSEEAVWSDLRNAAKAATGQRVNEEVVTGGFGSDTDPGVTGGYGDTGFGSLDNDLPDDNSEAPRQ